MVGAGGFTGGFICEEGLRRGYEVWAGVRESTSREYLSDPDLKFVVLDFENPDSLADSLRNAMGSRYVESEPDPESGISSTTDNKWDYIIYNLGATKCLNFADFNKINYTYLQRFTDALKEADLVPDKMVYISSLSAMGKGDEKGYTPFTEKMIPMPDTRYGASKLKAEMWLATCGIPTVIFRATGIYGPRDRDYFLMFESIRKGVDFTVGFKKQLLSFLYVEDLARACYDALERSKPGATYIIGEEQVYTQKEFRAIACEALGKRMVLPVKLPLFVLKIVSKIAEKWGAGRGKPSTLNSDKYNIMAQRNWAIDTSRARDGFGFKAEVPLREGVRRSVDWYVEKGWLKPLKKG